MALCVLTKTAVTPPTTNRIASAPRINTHVTASYPTRYPATVNRYDRREGNDDYKQAGDLFRLMTQSERRALISNVAGHMRGIPERIAKLQIEHFTKADPAYGRGVAEALGMEVGEPELANVKQHLLEELIHSSLEARQDIRGFQDLISAIFPHARLVVDRDDSQFRIERPNGFGTCVQIVLDLLAQF